MLTCFAEYNPPKKVEFVKAWLLQLDDREGAPLCATHSLLALLSLANARCCPVLDLLSLCWLRCAQITRQPGVASRRSSRARIANTTTTTAMSAKTNDQLHRCCDLLAYDCARKDLGLLIACLFRWNRHSRTSRTRARGITCCASTFKASPISTRYTRAPVTIRNSQLEIEIIGLFAC